MKFGLRMIRTTWPAAAFYVLCPPLALQAVVFLPTRFLQGFWGTIIATAACAVIGLAAKGAIVAFYVRYVENVSDDGSVRGERGSTAESVAV